MMRNSFVLIATSLLAIACATSTERGEPAPSNDPTTEVEAPGQVESAATTQSSCRWEMIACCNYNRNAKMAYQCYGAGSWHTISTRCASERPCAW